MSTSNCPDVALSLASYCVPIEVESSTNSSEPTHTEAVCIRASDSIAENETRAGDSNEELGSGMTEEESISPPAFGKSVSFLDWSHRGSGLERLGSGASVVSAGSALLDGENTNNYNAGDENKKPGMVEQGKLPSSQYKGVVPQPNGRWGAQIYEKHQRVWLGTFNREEDAAKAYDRAALKFRGRDAMTNFVPVGEGDPEALFLSNHSKGEIVDMLRKHTYDEEFDQSQKMAARPLIAQEKSGNNNNNVFSNCSDVKVAGSRPPEPREHLFDKAVTPSDVGKLNRLVIPKQHAEKYFPLDANAGGKGLLLNFEDNTGKMWRFRYSYWNSSQSYVLTKGWSRFVKEKKLNAGDIVSFYRGSQQLFITWRRRASGDASKAALGFNGGVKCFNPFVASEHPGGRRVDSLGYPGRMHLFWPGPGDSEALKSVNLSAIPNGSIPQLAVPEMWSRSPISVDSSTFCSKPAYDRNSAADFIKSPASGCLSNSIENKTFPLNSLSSKNSVRLFGVNLTSAPMISMETEYTAPLNLFPDDRSADHNESFEGMNKRKASLLLLSSLFSIDVQGNCIDGSNKLQCQGLGHAL